MNVIPMETASSSKHYIITAVEPVAAILKKNKICSVRIVRMLRKILVRILPITLEVTT